ncbi:hypothetical protein VKT23_019973 [Stygiomarasmius scandens]|uniref:Uncharacterized protein n=1 Tax=Marasmiellus scandens TaxID=2682957 RepID=A0ABR1IP29_9AGAR
MTIALEPSISYSEHFFCTSTIRETTWALCHVLSKGNDLADQDHPEHRTFIAIILAYWSRELASVTEPYFERDDLGHLPNVLEHDTLLGVLHLINLLDLGPMLWSETYYDPLNPDDSLHEKLYAEATEYAARIEWWLHENVILKDEDQTIFSVSSLRLNVLGNFTSPLVESVHAATDPQVLKQQFGQFMIKQYRNLYAEENGPYQKSWDLSQQSHEHSFGSGDGIPKISVQTATSKEKAEKQKDEQAIVVTWLHIRHSRYPTSGDSKRKTPPDDADNSQSKKSRRE